MNSKDTRAALLIAKRANGGVVLGDQRQANLSKFLEGNHPLVPHVLYHGTGRDISSFDTNAKRSYDVDPRNVDETDSGWYGKGHYLTSNPRVASHYASESEKRSESKSGANVMPVHVLMKNPFLVSRLGGSEMDRHLDAAGASPPINGKWRRASEQTEWLKSKGYDGVIANDKKDPGAGTEYVVFDSAQIKSALGNNGQFNPTSKDITKATGGAAEDTSQKIKGSDGVERFGFSFTPRAKRSIMKGQSAFARGGKVEPTDAQKSSGNYKKKHINFQGLPISIENEKGSIRSGQDEKGNKWSVKMPADYGYVKRTEGADGDHVDVYVGPDESSSNVFVIDQKDHRTGRFDEHKVMLGFDSLRSAIQSYTNGFSDGKAHLRLGNVARLSMKEFKQWLSHHDTKKPIRNQSAIDKALSVAKSAQGAKNGI